MRLPRLQSFHLSALFAILAAMPAGFPAIAQEHSWLDISDDIQFLPEEYRLDSIYDYHALYRPHGPLVDEASMTLTDDDYAQVAELLGCEIAAIKAVVDIEAGARHQGFRAPGKPIINFDLSIYRRVAPRHGVNLRQAQKSHPVIFERPNSARYGSRQAAQQARLDAACEIDPESALESTFWGMFQIGGFNWKRCGTADVNQFVALMSHSERDQLDLFARFCINTGLDRYIRERNWAEFARRYNGPSYRSRGYHTRLAAAYRRHLP